MLADVRRCAWSLGVRRPYSRMFITDGYTTGKDTFDQFTHKRSALDNPSWCVLTSGYATRPNLFVYHRTDKIGFGARYPPYTNKVRPRSPFLTDTSGLTTPSSAVAVDEGSGGTRPVAAAAPEGSRCEHRCEWWCIAEVGVVALGGARRGCIGCADSSGYC